MAKQIIAMLVISALVGAASFLCSITGLMLLGPAGCPGSGEFLILCSVCSPSQLAVVSGQRCIS